MWKLHKQKKSHFFFFLQEVAAFFSNVSPQSCRISMACISICVQLYALNLKQKQNKTNIYTENKPLLMTFPFSFYPPSMEDSR